MSEIGTLNEKYIHSTLKKYYEPDINNHEIKVGSYIADIKNNNSIIEIQTSNVKKLIPKIDYYLSKNFNVTIVYPITLIRNMIWLNQNEEIISKRTTKTYEVIQDAYYELSSIFKYIKDNKIIIKIAQLECNDFRHTDSEGNKQRKSKSNRELIPTVILSEIALNNINDLKLFIPKELYNKEFTSKEFKKESHVHTKYYASILKSLVEYNIISIIGRTGSSGRAYLYKLK